MPIGIGIGLSPLVRNGATLNQILPSDLPNLSQWIKPTAGEMFEDVAQTIPNDRHTGPVLSIKNKAASDYYTQANWMFAPELSKLNSERTLYFHGDSRMDSAIAGSATHKPWTCGVVVSAVNFTTERSILQQTSGVGGGIGLSLAATTGKVNLTKNNMVLMGASAHGLSPLVYHTIVITYDASGNWVIRIDGVEDATGTNNQTLSANQIRQVGAIAGGIRHYGNIRESVEYDRVLDASEITKLEKYLMPVDNSVYKYVATGYFPLIAGKFYALKSTDGKVWKYKPDIFLHKSANNKLVCPSIFYKDGTYWLAYVNIQTYDEATTSIILLNSTDLVNWVTVTTISVAGGAAGVLQICDANWFIDGETIRLIFGGTTIAGAWSAFQSYEIHATNAGLTTWSDPVLITGTDLQNYIIDPSIVKIGTYYYMFYKSEIAGHYHGYIARSESLTTGYSILKDLVEMGATWEAPCPIKIPNAWRVYIDHFTFHKTYYSDSFDDFATWSAVTECTSDPYLNHWSVCEIGVNTQHTY